MKIKHMEVMPHPRNPIGDFAVIKLFGISRLNGPATFRLEPLSRPGSAPPLGWLRGDLKPLAVRAGPGTVELLVGPDIVKAAALEPGTYVRFRMPSADADISIEWPDLQVTPGVSEQSEGTLAQSRLLPPSATVHQQQEVISAQAVTLSSVKAQRSVELQPRHAVLDPQPMPAEVVALKPVHTVDRGRASEAKALASAASRQLVPAAQHQSEPPPPQQRQSSGWVPVALGLVIVAALFVTFLRNTTVEGSSVTLYSALRATVAGSQRTVTAVKGPSLVLGEILEVGNVSPSGVDASGLTRRQALERANDLLGSMKTPGDREEAAFWLRKALSRSLSEPRLVWAVTQLGTAYASTDETNVPNYDAARLLWTWAANAGDAQAACFLARLYERGLGRAPNAKLARKSYVHARSLGGCPGLDQAMLRNENHR